MATPGVGVCLTWALAEDLEVVLHVWALNDLREVCLVPCCSTCSTFFYFFE